MSSSLALSVSLIRMFPLWQGHRHNKHYITRSGSAGCPGRYWSSTCLAVIESPVLYTCRPYICSSPIGKIPTTAPYAARKKSNRIALFRHLAMYAVRPDTLNWQYGQRTRLWCSLVPLWRHRRLAGVRFMVKSAVSYCFMWHNILFLELPFKSDLYSVKIFIYVSLKLRHYRTTINNISTPNDRYNVLCPKTNSGMFYIKHRLSLCIIYGNICVFLYCKIWLKTLKERVIQTNVPMKLFLIQHNTRTNEFLNNWERTIRICNKWKRNVKKKIEVSII